MTTSIPEMSDSMKSLVATISQHIDERGVPDIPVEVWRKMNQDYTKNEIREGLAHYIVRNNPEFPMKRIAEKSVHRNFHKLLSDSMDGTIIHNLRGRKVIEKYDDYKYPFSQCGFALLELGHEYNDISNYFQQRNRLSCGAYGFKAPMEIWKDYDALRKMNYTFWRLGNETINHRNWAGSFRLGSYVATQFKPHMAKCIYVMTGATRVLDTSCGWGDRLAGFYCSPSVKEYYGCDPNENVFETYKKQCVWYEKALTGREPKLTESDNWFECSGAKFVRILRSPAEDIDWTENARGKFDLLFTSPPYFSTERYNEGGANEKDQSWSRYNEYESWRDGFLLKMLDSAWDNTRDGGYIMINMMDPKIGSRRYYACDDMVDYMVDKKSASFMGQIGMRIKQRPKKMEGLQEYLQLDYIENIWCFGKGVSSLPTTSDLESFMT